MVLLALLAVGGFMYPRISAVASELALVQSRLLEVEHLVSNGSLIQSTLIPHLHHLFNGGSNMRDFALARGGAAIIPELTRSTWKSPTPPASRLFGSKITDFTNARAYLAITPDMEYGSCWAFNGPTGHVGVTLPIPVRITNVSIDHISKDLVPDVSPAPRAMVLWGLLEGEALSEHRRNPLLVSKNQHQPSQSIRDGLRLLSVRSDAEFIEISRFDYDPKIDLAHSQMFPIYPEVVESGLDFGIIVLEILSNWGSQRTCLYRVRIHGD